MRCTCIRDMENSAHMCGDVLRIALLAISVVPRATVYVCRVSRRVHSFDSSEKSGHLLAFPPLFLLYIFTSSFCFCFFVGKRGRAARARTQTQRERERERERERKKERERERERKREREREGQRLRFFSLLRLLHRPSRHTKLRSN